jgi:hypothetical protein
VFWLELSLLMLVTAPFWWPGKALPSLLDYRDRRSARNWIPHIYVIRQLVIIESFWWVATYNLCRTRVLSATDCRKKMSGSFAQKSRNRLPTTAEEVIHGIAERNGVHR